MNKTIAWDVYFLELAKTVAIKSTCSRRQIGSILIRGHDLVSMGYNGTPMGTESCGDGGCLRCNDSTIPSGTQYDICRCSHSEHNAVLMAARQGLSTNKTTLYTTQSPCQLCILMLIQAGITRIVYLNVGSFESFSDDLYDIIDKSGIKVERFENGKSKTCVYYHPRGN
jgi:dCMP deaminase